MKCLGRLLLVTVGSLVLSASLHAEAGERPQPQAAGYPVIDGLFCYEIAELALDPVALTDEVLQWVLEKLGVIQIWVPEEARTLPAPHYLDHPPQFIPPCEAAPRTAKQATSP
jgi:hypothetical protein